jgi:hypothetical protein
MENKNLTLAIVNLINDRMNNATPGTAVFAELAYIKQFIYQNLLSTRMNADMNDEVPSAREPIKEISEKRFNEKFWKVGNAYSLKLPERYVDVILVEIIKDDYGIIRLRFVAGVQLPGYNSDGFSITVYEWEEDKIACTGGTHIDHPVVSGEELSDVEYKIFDEDWFEKESVDWIDFEGMIINRALIKVEFRGSTMIGFVDPRKTLSHEFDLYVDKTIITIYPTPEEMDSIKIYSLKYLKEEKINE